MSAEDRRKRWDIIGASTVADGFNSAVFLNVTQPTGLSRSRPQLQRHLHFLCGQRDAYAGVGSSTPNPEAKAEEIIKPPERNELAATSCRRPRE
jgi:hypothetical protein